MPDDIIMQTIIKLEKTLKMPSSMHRDVKITELVINEGVKYEIPTPTYQMVLKNYVPFACLVKGYHYI
jgi:2-dehydropantoate 2-reductase